MPADEQLFMPLLDKCRPRATLMAPATTSSVPKTTAGVVFSTRRSTRLARSTVHTGEVAVMGETTTVGPAARAKNRSRIARVSQAPEMARGSIALRCQTMGSRGSGSAR